ncbi:MAG: MFS transporter [Acidobacteria bacterium]|nr:MFS transporter [Acidobacteriota bacterium]
MSERSRIGMRLDRLPICSFHRRILLLIGAGLYLDAFDIYMQGPILAELVRINWSDNAGNAAFLSATFAGLTLGTLLSGWAGDRFGRRAIYQFNLLLFGLATLVAALSPTFEFLLVCRFVSGIGLGGEVITSYGALAEFVPAQQRGKWQSLLLLISNLSIPTSALVCWVVIPRFGWRWMFVAVGLLSVILWTARRAMPESPRWYESRGRYAEAQSQIVAIEAEVEKATGQSMTAVLPEAQAINSRGNSGSEEPRSIGALFKGQMLRRTFLAIILMVCMNVSIFAITAWIPTILVQSGMAIGNTFFITAVMLAGSLPGALIGAWSMDRLGRRQGLIGFSMLTAAVTTTYAFLDASLELVATGFMLTLLLYVLVAMTFSTYVPEIFPTALRLTGSAISNSMGRMANIFAPFGVVLLLNNLGARAVYFSVAGVLVAQALSVFILGEETRQKSLEEIQEMAKSH